MFASSVIRCGNNNNKKNTPEISSSYKKNIIKPRSSRTSLQFRDITEVIKGSYFGRSDTPKVFEILPLVRVTATLMREGFAVEGPAYHARNVIIFIISHALRTHVI